MTSSISLTETNEFKVEAAELLDDAERHLLNLEKGGEFKATYDAVFRVFHSIKGGAGMLGLTELQSHMHQLENNYQQCKDLSSLSKEIVTYFLEGVDIAKRLLEGESNLEFNRPFQVISKNTETPTPSQSVQAPPAAEVSRPPSEFSLPSRVIVIDDEPDIVEILTDILTKDKYEVYGFSSSRQALESVEKIKPDVVLTDLNMPDIDGPGVLMALAEKAPELPVIFISGYVTKDIILNALSYGVFAAIEKPFNGNRVLEVCANAAQKHRMSKLVNHLISFIYYQYSEIEEILEKSGQSEKVELMRQELQTLVEARRKLKNLQRKPAKA